MAQATASSGVAPVTRRLALLVGYDGTEFHGSQAQPGARTVQGELERVLQQVARGSGRLAFAGRTDRGVHAVGQVATGDIAWDSSAEALRDALNALAPPDIAVGRVWEVPREFHARFSAIGREYRYAVQVAPAPPALERRYVWWRRTPLDADLAQAACARLLGTHAFGSFAGAGRSQRRDASQLTRTVRVSEWSAAETAGSPARVAVGETRHTFRMSADGFLPQMVRNIVGAICQVAEGRRPVEWIDELLAANDRRAYGEAAPPHGLVFWQALYDNSDTGCEPFGRVREE